LRILKQILISASKIDIIMATSKKKNISREELRALMPKKLNKLGEWFFSNDEDKLYVEVKDMRAVLK
jgi:hypothetical protein